MDFLSIGHVAYTFRLPVRLNLVDRYAPDKRGLLYVFSILLLELGQPGGMQNNLPKARTHAWLNMWRLLSGVDMMGNKLMKCKSPNQSNTKGQWNLCQCHRSAPFSLNTTDGPIAPRHRKTIRRYSAYKSIGSFLSDGRGRFKPSICARSRLAVEVSKARTAVNRLQGASKNVDLNVHRIGMKNYSFYSNIHYINRRDRAAATYSLVSVTTTQRKKVQLTLSLIDIVLFEIAVTLLLYEISTSREVRKKSQRNGGYCRR